MTFCFAILLIWAASLQSISFVLLTFLMADFLDFSNFHRLPSSTTAQAPLTAP